MIIMVNGSFGVGKTSVSTEIAKTLPNSMIYDPELVGEMLNQATIDVRSADEDTDDFQDLKMWPDLVIEFGLRLQEHYGRNLVVPMTIDKVERLSYIRKGFESFDKEVHHFCLIAPIEVVLKRLEGRGCSNGKWVVTRAKECVAAFKGASFQKCINATVSTPQEISNQILGSINKL